MKVSTFIIILIAFVIVLCPVSSAGVEDRTVMNVLYDGNYEFPPDSWYVSGLPDRYDLYLCDRPPGYVQPFHGRCMAILGRNVNIEVYAASAPFVIPENAVSAQASIHYRIQTCEQVGDEMMDVASIRIATPGTYWYLWTFTEDDANTDWEYRSIALPIEEMKGKPLLWEMVLHESQDDLTNFYVDLAGVLVVVEEYKIFLPVVLVR